MKQKGKDREKKRMACFLFGYRESNSGPTGPRWKIQTLENANARTQGPGMLTTALYPIADCAILLGVG